VNQVVLTREELDVLVREAAREGARQALAEVGLHDDTAPHDIRELRNLIDSWRSAKKTIGSTILKTLTTAALLFIAGAVAMKMGFGGGN
jgi:2-iminoacetate synthase ThiH